MNSKCTFLLFFLIHTLFAQQQNYLAEAQAFVEQQKFAFEENKGQIWNTQGEKALDVRYHFQQKGFDIFMLPTGLAYQFTKVHYPAGYKIPSKAPFTKEDQAIQDALKEKIRVETYRMDMELVNANPNPTIVAEEKSNDYVQYYNRNTLAVHSFQKLTYKEVYSGIDWVIYTTDKGLKYDFIVQPNANPKQIKMRFKHHKDLKINADGSFTLSSQMGQITEQAPVSFQGEKEITTNFQLQESILSFVVENYDNNQKLVIDPTLIWGSYYGGANIENGYGSTVDAAGNLYLVGRTNSHSAIAAGGHQIFYWGGTGLPFFSGDAFIVKFTPTGTRLWASYYGGNNNDSGVSCTTDASSNIYLTGSTASPTNIATTGGHQNTIGGMSDAFIVKFNSNGTRLWASYYGGSEDDQGASCAIDNNGNVYLAGETKSTTAIATTGGHQNTIGGMSDAFIVKFNSNGTRLWASYYGGSSSEYGTSCATDQNNNVYLSGISLSTTNIALGGHQNTFGGGRDAFIAKIRGNNCITTTGNAIHTACDSFTWIDGTTYTTSNNSAIFTITNTAGCDSIVTLNLTINNNNAETDIQMACNSYTWIDGNTYTASNNSATFTLTNTAGCDSIITLNLTLNNIDTTITVIGNTMMANAVGANYQWLDCDNSNAPISGATTQAFTPTRDGNYAVTIIQNGCTATSSCLLFTGIGIDQIDKTTAFYFYPNPSKGKIYLDFEAKEVRNTTLTLYSIDGKVMQQQTPIQTSLHQLELPKTTGVYILTIQSEKGVQHYKVVKE